MEDPMHGLALDPSLNNLPHAFQDSRNWPKLRVHLLGIGGVAMASLAGLLKDSGFLVTGSDEGIYPPTQGLLKDLKIPVTTGYGEKSLPGKLDLVIIGNVVTRRFPVLKTIAAQKIPYLSLPQTLKKLFLKDTKNLVIAGCHGKTTTTNLAAFLFEKGGFAPGFLIGGVSRDFQVPFRLAKKDWFIIEGDEYDSAFFNKVPKFVHYQPHTVILNNIEFDHADIYPNLDAVIASYQSLVDLIPQDGLLIANGDDPLVRQVSKGSKAQVIFFGKSKNVDWRIKYFYPLGYGSSFWVEGPEGLKFKVSWKKMGIHNALNAVGALAAYHYAGGDLLKLSDVLPRFQGPARRQEIKLDLPVTIMDDFAHHPTAVLEVLKSLKDSKIPRRILCAFEPRSNTTRRSIFQEEYVKSLSLADLVFIAKVNHPEKVPPSERLDVLKLASDIGKNKNSENVSKAFNTISELKDALIKIAELGDLIIIMSNGDFGGLVDSLIANYQTIPSKLQTKAQPKEHIAKPEEHIAQPEEHIVKSKEHIVKSKETKAKPKEHKAKPKETKAKPKETKAKPKETKAKPKEHKVQPKETKGKLQKSGSQTQSDKKAKISKAPLPKITKDLRDLHKLKTQDSPKFQAALAEAKPLQLAEKFSDGHKKSKKIIVDLVDNASGEEFKVPSKKDLLALEKFIQTLKLNPTNFYFEPLNHTFKNSGYLIGALTHRSHINDNFENDSDEVDNQRLEFLGDRVLDLCVSQYLFSLEPRLSEGTMSRLRACFVRESRLAEIARSIDLGSYLFLSQSEDLSGGRSKSSLLADAMEALLGAVFLDSGLDSAYKIVLTLWKPFLSCAKEGKPDIYDYKTDLQEFTQSKGLGLPSYSLTNTMGPAHNPSFFMCVSVGGHPSRSRTAMAHSKKVAAQLAAKALLEELKAEESGSS
ncbi:MAG: ribonuclease III [Deltaproteobacteria bacterium]|jgi:UDP-N-acetylmuramate: L-alanyl-gamma-D-glutamyl-meso-diaminopimelate ligase|nr:ribonuclease III [Deltaproteobacteria bacterium]